MYFCECLDDNNLPNTPIQETIKLATLDAVERIMYMNYPNGWLILFFTYLPIIIIRCSISSILITVPIGTVS